MNSWQTNVLWHISAPADPWFLEPRDLRRGIRLWFTLQLEAWATYLEECDTVLCFLLWPPHPKIPIRWQSIPNFPNFARLSLAT